MAHYALKIGFGETPSWVPAENTAANFGTSLNTGIGRSVAFWTANGGLAWAPWWGTHGSYITSGGGHGDGSENDVWRFDIDTQTLSQLKASASIFIKPSGANATYVARELDGWMYDNAVAGDTTVQTGEPFAPHAALLLQALPESAIPGEGATNGWLHWIGLHSMPVSGQRGTYTAQKLRMGVDTTYTLASATGLPLIESYWWPLGNGCYDPSRNRVWYHLNFSPAVGGAPSTMLGYRDIETGASSSQTFTGIDSYAGGLNEAPFFLAAYDCIVCVGIVDASPTTVGVVVYDLTTNLVYRPTLSGTAPVVDERAGKTWSDSWGKLALVCAANTSKVWFLTPGANPRTDAWTWGSTDIIGTLQFPSATSGIATGLNRLHHVSTAGDVLLWCGKESEPAQVINVTPP